MTFGSYGLESQLRHGERPMPLPLAGRRALLVVTQRRGTRCTFRSGIIMAECSLILSHTE